MSDEFLTRSLSALENLITDLDDMKKKIEVETGRAENKKPVGMKRNIGEIRDQLKEMKVIVRVTK